MSTPFISTPGIDRATRLEIAHRSKRDERTVAKVLRGERVKDQARASIVEAARALGIEPPAVRP